LSAEFVKGITSKQQLEVWNTYEHMPRKSTRSQSLGHQKQCKKRHSLSTKTRTFFGFYYFMNRQLATLQPRADFNCQSLVIESMARRLVQLHNCLNTEGSQTQTHQMNKSYSLIHLVVHFSTDEPDSEQELIFTYMSDQYLSVKTVTKTKKKYERKQSEKERERGSHQD